MRRILLPALIGAVMSLGGGPVSAQVFGQYTGAQPLPVNGHLFGAYLNASDNVVGLLAQLRLSFYPGVDFGFQGGLTRIDFGGTDVTTLRVGGDLKFLVASAGESFPVDLAVSGALGVETGDDISLLSLGPGVVASRDLSVGNSGRITPYAGLGLLFSRIDVGSLDDSDMSFPIRMGADFQLAPELRIMAEIQFLVEDEFNDDVVFVTGVNLPF